MNKHYEKAFLDGSVYGYFSAPAPHPDLVDSNLAMPFMEKVREYYVTNNPDKLQYVDSFINNLWEKVEKCAFLSQLAKDNGTIYLGAVKCEKMDKRLVRDVLITMTEKNTDATLDKNTYTVWHSDPPEHFCSLRNKKLIKNVEVISLNYIDSVKIDFYITATDEVSVYLDLTNYREEDEDELSVKTIERLVALYKNYLHNIFTYCLGLESAFLSNEFTAKTVKMPHEYAHTYNFTLSGEHNLWLDDFLGEPTLRDLTPVHKDVKLNTLNRYGSKVWCVKSDDRYVKNDYAVAQHGDLSVTSTNFSFHTDSLEDYNAFVTNINKIKLGKLRLMKPGCWEWYTTSYATYHNRIKSILGEPVSFTDVIYSLVSTKTITYTTHEFYDDKLNKCEVYLYSRKNNGRDEFVFCSDVLDVVKYAAGITMINVYKV